MATSVTFNSTAYSVPASGELNWADLSDLLVDVGNNGVANTVNTAQLALATGSAGAPTYSFNGNTNTGVYQGGANTVSIATGGSVAVTVNSSQQVGIGTTGPTQLLDIDESTSTNALIRMANSTDNAFIGVNDNPTTGFMVGLAAGGLGFRSNGVEIGFSTDSGSTQHMLIDGSGNVGIGDASPSFRLHAVESSAGGTADFSLQNSSNTANSNSRLRIQTGGSSAGDSTLYFNTQRTDEWSMGVDVSDSSRFKIGKAAVPETNTRFGIQTNGIIEVDSSSWGTSGADDVNITAGVGAGKQLIQVTSSIRYKEDVRDLEGDTSRIFELRPVNFKWKKEGHQDFGLIAEEVRDVYPELCNYPGGTDPDGKPTVSSVRYKDLAIPLLAEVKKLYERVTKLEQRLV